MQFIRITSEGNKFFNDAMTLYKTSFPIFEQRTIKSQIEALKNDTYNCNAVYENSELIGILFYWKYDGYVYIEHLAICPNLRGKQYGSKILKTFCKQNKNTILEIDPPIDDISLKRLNFYSKLGFKIHDFEHIHPPYRKNYNGHKLKVMSFNKTLSQDEFNKFSIFLKETVMKYSEFNL